MRVFTSFHFCNPLRVSVLLLLSLFVTTACDGGDTGGVSNEAFPVVVQNDYAESLFTVSYTVTDATSPHAARGTLFNAERIDGLKSKKSEDVIHADSDDTVVITFSATSLGQVRTFEPITVKMSDKRYSDTVYRIAYDYDLATASFTIRHGWSGEFSRFSADGDAGAMAMNCTREDGFCDLYPEPPEDDGGTTTGRVSIRFVNALPVQATFYADGRAGSISAYHAMRWLPAGGETTIHDAAEAVRGSTLQMSTLLAAESYPRYTHDSTVQVLSPSTLCTITARTDADGFAVLSTSCT